MELATMDLLVDKVYIGGRNNNFSDDPLPELMGVDSGAGFRHIGPRPEVDTLRLLVLKSNFNDRDWPDSMDRESGTLTYYGDNKSVKEIHDTPRQGNMILKNLFSCRHSPAQISRFPAIFVFGGTGSYRDVQYLGLAVPGAQHLGPDEDLLAIWRTKDSEDQRFQNYKSIFTILDVPVVSRQWLEDLKKGDGVISKHAPEPWLDWLNKRKYTPLLAPRTIEIRSKKEQLPRRKEEVNILLGIYEKFKDNPHSFERCAVEIARLMMPSIGACELTRPWFDGGRDAIGYYSVGKGPSSIQVEFALEAKCYQAKSGVGVKHTSRLISRIRHRQFGIFVTTSYLSASAYKEMKEDKHPIVVITGIDIALILKDKIGSMDNIQAWLTNFE